MSTYITLRDRFCLVLALGISAFELYTVGFGILSPLAQRATLLLLAGVLIFLLNPTARWPQDEALSAGRRTLAIAWDVVMIGACIVACAYLVIEERELGERGGIETTLDLFIAGLGPVMLLDMVRRVAGVPLFIVSTTVILYAYFGDVVLLLASVGLATAAAWKLGGLRAALAVAVVVGLALLLPDARALLDPANYPYRGSSFYRMAPYMWLTSDGTFGSIAAIMSQFIFIFILFAALLETTGAGAILMNLAFAMTGRYRGGPAQAAVVASSMFGVVSGSTVANVVSTGTFTIPLMIRTGFSRAFAGAVESVASCGGQLVPPVMGASVFIMAEIVGIPYVQLMLYAIIPAILYYASLSTAVYFESARLGLRRMSIEDIPNGMEQIRRGGYLLIPVVLLLASIISGETPGRAGFKAVLSLIVMVDLVRTLRWVRANYGTPAATAIITAVVGALLLAYGPLARPEMLVATVTLPWLGQIELLRLGLFALGALFAVVPALRGLPVAFPIGLSLANWRFPTELEWLGTIPYVGLILPIAATLGILWLLWLAVCVNDPVPTAKDSAAEFGKALIAGLASGARNAASLVAATYVIGLIVGMLVLAALGVRISIFVTEVASTSLFLAFVLVMFASLIMGMGLPTIAAYLLLVIVVAPSLGELGAPLVASHMFIFYYGVLSSITPPVALAAYAASGISGGDPMRTGFTACRLAATAFIVPYLLVYHPELLLLEGTNAGDLVHRLVTASIGIIFVSMAAMGFGVVVLSPASRLLLAAAALLLFLDPIWANLAGIALGAGHVAWQVRQRRIGPGSADMPA